MALGCHRPFELQEKGNIWLVTNDSEMSARSRVIIIAALMVPFATWRNYCCRFLSQKKQLCFFSFKSFFFPFGSWKYKTRSFNDCNFPQKKKKKFNSLSLSFKHTRTTCSLGLLLLLQKNHCSSTDPRRGRNC